MGLEPTRPIGHKILSLACLPISALPQTTRDGIEPTTSAVTGRRSNRLSHRAISCPENCTPEKYSKLFLDCQHQTYQHIYCRRCHILVNVEETFTLHSSCAHWISPRPISNYHLNALQHLQLSPINLVVFKGSYSCDGISHLEGGFTLRCLQRLSSPDMPTLRWL